MPDDRSFDIVLFGATGFSGALTAEYLARHAGPECRWALAGRNQAKLEALRERLAAIDAVCAELPLLHADVTDPASLREVAGSTHVAATTVGPYIHHGEPLVAACAEAGTDYLDITGEPEFVDRMYVRYHDRARASGARLVHACGFDSIPHDLGVYYTVKQLPEGVPLRINGFVRAGGRPSGGTVHSAITASSRMRHMAQAANARRKAEPRPTNRKVHTSVGVPRRHEGWALPFPVIDQQIVNRSARALDRYGPDFSYHHYVVVEHLATAAGLAAGAAGLAGLAQIPPARRWLLGRIQSGEGPTPERRVRSWFKVTFEGEGGGRRVVTEVSGGDPGYDETAKMLGESALCMAFDDLPKDRGQLTTAVAMGDALVDRLQRAGIAFRTLTDDPISRQ